MIQEHKRNEDLRIAIAKKVKKVCIINKLIKETQENYKNLQHIKKANHDENRALRIILPKYEEKVNKLGDFVAGAEEKNDGLRGKCLTLEDQLKLVRRNYIGKLLQYIFPISQTLGTSTSIRSLNESKDQTELMQRDTENELAEAIKLAFVRGKWISQNESMTELQYVIVAPSLPSNGDYTAYSDWIFSQNKDMPNATTTSGTGR